jgi:hypothetical protein
MQPIIFPGSAVRVVNEGDTYFGFQGQVQRVTDERVAVIFGGGNWEKIVSFRATELELIALKQRRNNRGKFTDS